MITIYHLFQFIPLLLLVQGFFSGAEIALMSADKILLDKKMKSGNRGARLALFLANQPEIVLSTTLLLSCVSVITSSSLLVLYFQSYETQYKDILTILILSPAVVLFGELLPKVLYQKKSTQIAVWIAYPVYATYLMFYPLTRLLSAYNSKLVRLISPFESLLVGKARSVREDIRAVLSLNQIKSDIQPIEKNMVKKILEFKKFQAKNAMIPLMRVHAIDIRLSVQQVLEAHSHIQHSRLPVYENRIDNIVGVVQIGDILNVVNVNKSIQQYLTLPYYAAENQLLSIVMREMHDERKEMAIVVDEHGGAIGILTLEDICEVIVGDIYDETDEQEVPFREISPVSWLAQATVKVKQLNEDLKFDLPLGEYETLSGYLLAQFGRIPKKRDSLTVQTRFGTLQLTIQHASIRQIQTVLIEKK